MTQREFRIREVIYQMVQIVISDDYKVLSNNDATALAAYIIQERMSASGIAQVTDAQLQKHFGTSAATISRWVKLLSKAPWMTIIRGTRNKATEYHITDYLLDKAREKRRYQEAARARKNSHSSLSSLQGSKGVQPDKNWGSSTQQKCGAFKRVNNKKERTIGTQDTSAIPLDNSIRFTLVMKDRRSRTQNRWYDIIQDGGLSDEQIAALIPPESPDIWMPTQRLLLDQMSKQSELIAAAKSHANDLIGTQSKVAENSKLSLQLIDNQTIKGMR